MIIKKIKQKNIDLSPRKNIIRQQGELHLKSTLFSKGRKTEAFFTEDSKLYITPREQELLKRGVLLDRSAQKWDSLTSRIVNDFEQYSPSLRSKITEKFEERYARLQEYSAQTSQNILSQFSVVRLWNISIVGAILFGMVTMTFVYRYLGQGASAREVRDPAVQEQILGVSDSPKVLGAKTSKQQTKKTAAEVKTDERKKLENDIRAMVKGRPMEKMVPYIANYDRTVASFIVAIAKKESGWGEHVPVLNGQDCYNYWGYRGKRELMGTGGHTCFNSPKDAVDTVAKRIDFLVSNENRNTPQKMVLWKCGSACNKDAGAKKWIDDVSAPFEKLNKR